MSDSRQVPLDDRGIAIKQFIDNFTEKVMQTDWTNVKSLDAVLVKNDTSSEHFHVGEHQSTIFGAVKMIKTVLRDHFPDTPLEELERFVIENFRKE